MLAAPMLLMASGLPGAVSAHREAQGSAPQMTLADAPPALRAALNATLDLEAGGDQGTNVEGPGGERGADDTFGYSLAVSSDTAVIGATEGDTPTVTDAGAVYVFVRSGPVWRPQAKLTAPDAAFFDRFGWSVDIDGNTLVIGAYLDDSEAGSDAGSAHVFVRSGTSWAHQAHLTHPEPDGGDWFGDSVALDGDTIVVGARSDDTPAGTHSGSAHVYVRSGAVWAHQAELVAPDTDLSDEFGHAVALSGDTAVVGARYDSTLAFEAGSAHVFVRSGAAWAHQAKLTAPDAAAGDWFGDAVALDGDTVVVGARADDTPAGASAGSAYVFVQAGASWGFQAQLLAPDASELDQHFGASVAVLGDTALVGASADNPHDIANAGSAYVFVRNGSAWTPQAKLTAPDPLDDDELGTSVSLDGDTALVGAPYDWTPGGSYAGSVHVFVRSGTAWSPQAQLVAPDGDAPDAFGSSVAIDGDTAIVGARGGDTVAGFDAGAAYVFVRAGTAWGLQAKLRAPDGDALDSFGNAVALSGDTAVVGATLDELTPATEAGSAYVFVRSGTTWAYQAKLIVPNGRSVQHFGYSVAVSGDTALVGDGPQVVPGLIERGSAYVFVRSGTAWSPQAELTPGDVRDAFGAAVAVEGETALVGDYLDDAPPPLSPGTAHVFVRTGTDWPRQARLLAPDGGNEDYFGVSVAIDGDTAVIGASEGGTRPGPGAAYVFVRTGTSWAAQAKLTAPDGASRDLFGGSVAVHDDTAVVGASGDDHPSATRAGSAYVFIRSGTSWSPQEKITAPDAAPGDAFGSSVALYADTILVGSPADNVDQLDAGSAYVFVRSGSSWSPQAKLRA